MSGRAVALTLALAILSVANAGCGMCTGGCDETVHPYPLRSASYFDAEGEDCRSSAEIPSDAGENVDAGVDVICEEGVKVDETSRTVIQRFTYQGQQHVVRYRAVRVETIDKGFEQ